MKKLTIGEMQKIAEKREGKCLSENYSTANIKLKWQCKKGHIWEATPGSVKSGTWCRICSLKKSGELKRKQKINRICQNCGKEFEVYPYKIKEGKGKFCSKKCFKLFKIDKTKTNPKRIRLKCVICGNEFYEYPSRINDNRGKFCSKECYYTSKKGKPSLKLDRVKIICQVCGREFYVNRARANSGRTKFCSNKCRGKSLEGTIPWNKNKKDSYTKEQRKRMSEAQKERYKKGLVP